MGLLSNINKNFSYSGNLSSTMGKCELGTSYLSFPKAHNPLFASMLSNLSLSGDSKREVGRAEILIIPIEF